MKLIPVTPAYASTHMRCVGANHPPLTRWVPQREMFADLDGEPFRAYYCAPCAAEAQKTQEQKP